MKTFALTLTMSLGFTAAAQAAQTLDCAWQFGPNIVHHQYEIQPTGGSLSSFSNGFGGAVAVNSQNGVIKKIFFRSSGKNLEFPVSGAGPYNLKGRIGKQAVSVTCEADVDSKEFLARYVRQERGLCEVNAQTALDLMKQSGLQLPSLSNFSGDAETFMRLDPSQLARLAEVPKEQMAQAVTMDPRQSLRMIAIYRASALAEIEAPRDPREREIVTMLVRPMLLLFNVSESLVNYAMSRISEDPALSASAPEKLQTVIESARALKSEYPRLKTQAQLWGMGLQGPAKARAEKMVQNLGQSLNRGICRGVMTELAH